MKIRVILFLVLIFHSYYAKSQLNMLNYFNNPNWHESQTKMGTAQILTFSEKHPQIDYINNVVYSSRDGNNLTLQILRPKTGFGEVMKRCPCVIYIQGSAWMKQNVYANLPALAKFAERGYVVAVVEYTHSGLAPFPVPLQDVKTAIRFMRKNADTYGVDEANLFVWGDSSGGHLSLMTAVTGGMDEFDTLLYKEYSTDINACVSYYGVSDIKSIHTDPCSASTGLEDSPEGLLLGGKKVADHTDEADIASPFHYVTKERPIVPILLAVGTCDHIVPFSQSELMAAALDKTGKEYAYYVLKGADHGSWEFWTPQTFDVVDKFLKSHMR